MALAVEHVADDVVRLSMSGWRGRAVGYVVSAYLMRGVLIDTGFPGVCAELLDAVMTFAPRGGIVTHSHEDHAGNAPTLAARGLPFLMHDACEAVLRHCPPIQLYRRLVWGHAPRLVSDIVPFDPAPLEIIPAPGHTEDHVVVWDAERRILATGDLFLGVKVRVAHIHESPLKLIESLRAAAALEPVLLLDAHRGVVQNPVPLLNAKVAFMEETIGRIRALADKGASEREIQHRVLGREPLVGLVSVGEYSKRAYVHSVLAT